VRAGGGQGEPEFSQQRSGKTSGSAEGRGSSDSDGNIGGDAISEGSGVSIVCARGAPRASRLAITSERGAALQTPSCYDELELPLSSEL